MSPAEIGSSASVWEANLMSLAFRQSVDRGNRRLSPGLQGKTCQGLENAFRLAALCRTIAGSTKCPVSTISNLDQVPRVLLTLSGRRRIQEHNGINYCQAPCCEFVTQSRYWTRKDEHTWELGVAHRLASATGQVEWVKVSEAKVASMVEGQDGKPSASCLERCSSITP